MEDEFAFIASISPIKNHQQSLVLGIGDDAAVYRGSDETDEVVCVDTMVEGIHFRRDTLSLQQLGKKALAVNISDIAAMGATPVFYLVSIAIPPTWQKSELTEIYEGMSVLAKEYKMDLIGGDTVSTVGALVLTVTVIGRVKRDRSLYRHNAKSGDVLFLTGNVGSSAAGLALLLERGLIGPFNENEQVLVRAHQEPEPHVIQGNLLSSVNKRVSLNDVSDGIASEANELAEASLVNITINADFLPFHDSMKAYSQQERLEWALFGGEDYVLIGTIAKEDVPMMREVFREKDQSFQVIGTVEEGKSGVFLKEGDHLMKLNKQGYNHFQNRG